MDRIVQGRCVGSAELSEIRALLSAHPEWGRSRLSVALCERWGWRDGRGRVKDIAARSLLRKLAGEGLIRLPALQYPGRGSRRHSAAARVGLEVDWSVSEAFSGPLSALLPRFCIGCGRFGPPASARDFGAVPLSRAIDAGGGEHRAPCAGPSGPDRGLLADGGCGVALRGAGPLDRME